MAIRHIKNLEPVFYEENRIISKGKFLIFTSDKKQMEGYWLNHYFPTMMEQSINAMHTLEDVVDKLQKSKFTNITTEKYYVKNDLRDLFLYSGKHKPEQYLDFNIRNGSSSFSNLSNKDEVDKGLELLSQDIETLEIKKS